MNVKRIRIEIRGKGGGNGGKKQLAQRSVNTVEMGRRRKMYMKPKSLCQNCVSRRLQSLALKTYEKRLLFATKPTFLYLVVVPEHITSSAQLQCIT